MKAAVFLLKTYLELQGRPVIHFQSAVEVHHPTSLEGESIGQPSENSRLAAEAPQVSRVPLTASTGHVSLKEKVFLNWNMC